MKPLEIDEKLEAVVGKGPLPRGQITKKIWDYIKAHNLQDSNNKRMINSDDKLKEVFDGQSQINMLQMGKYVSNHIKK